jgi:hypothetical protein
MLPNGRKHMKQTTYCHIHMTIVIKFHNCYIPAKEQSKLCMIDIKMWSMKSKQTWDENITHTCQCSISHILESMFEDWEWIATNYENKPQGMFATTSKRSTSSECIFWQIPKELLPSS